MISPKSANEIKKLRAGGRQLARILETVKVACESGVRLAELDEIAKSVVEDIGGKAAFFNYQPTGAKRPYPAHICVSINEEIVHGIPVGKERELKEGDMVTLDMGLIWEDLITDSAITFVVGEPTAQQTKLLKTTKQALMAGIEVAQPGARVGDVSAAIQASVPDDFSIFKELVGHGVGYSVHEDPYIPNVGTAGTGAELPVGAVLAIEPMIGVGGSGIALESDGYTYKTKDSSLSAHFEHTVAVTAEGPLILTES